MAFRIGQGYDVHALAQGLPLIIGGVKIEHAKGCVAHSDGDVLAHAICDALLGAAAMGDIGQHFPDTQDEYKGVDSMVLLRKVVEMVRRAGYRVVNIDSTVTMQTPKLAPHIPRMVQALSHAMEIDPLSISVKATTSEKLGFEGRQEGVSALAITLIERE